ACPRGVLFEHKSEETPIKCTLCGACVEACPREALAFEKEKIAEGG
ncbi:MAG: 4Fe-4S dicluster domain-containing protein, partial [Desulfobacterales bacterium]|nr:4Fe-4S dicluster domain-containing protein [Desulfobacterales bacterium]